MLAVLQYNLLHALSSLLLPAFFTRHHSSSPMLQTAYLKPLFADSVKFIFPVRRGPSTSQYFETHPCPTLRPLYLHFSYHSHNAEAWGSPRSTLRQWKECFSSITPISRVQLYSDDDSVECQRSVHFHSILAELWKSCIPKTRDYA